MEKYEVSLVAAILSDSSSPCISYTSLICKHTETLSESKLSTISRLFAKASSSLIYKHIIVIIIFARHYSCNCRDQKRQFVTSRQKLSNRSWSDDDDDDDDDDGDGGDDDELS